MVQLGFVTGTAVLAVLNLADVVPARRLFAVSATLGTVGTSSSKWSQSGRESVGAYWVAD